MLFLDVSHVHGHIYYLIDHLISLILRWIAEGHLRTQNLGLVSIICIQFFFKSFVYCSEPLPCCEYPCLISSKVSVEHAPIFRTSKDPQPCMSNSISLSNCSIGGMYGTFIFGQYQDPQLRTCKPVLFLSPFV